MSCRSNFEPWSLHPSELNIPESGFFLDTSGLLCYSIHMFRE
jgi:hypothetical protein